MLISRWVVLLQMIKFSHSVFALPFAVLGAFLAAGGGVGGFPGWGRLGLIVWCMVCARSMAMTFNRIVDARIDARNPRTANRAIPAGQITRRQANRFLFLCALGFGAGCWLFYRPLGEWFGYGNRYPAIFCLPVMLVICLYSFTKRFTSLSHFWLGLSLGLAPMAAWVAICPPQGPLLGWPAVILGGAVLLWTAGFDIIYALQDVEVDRREGLFSLPARWGVNRALWISRLCHSLTVTLLLSLMLVTRLQMFYFIAVVLTAGLFILEHILVRGGRKTHVAIAFGFINGLVSMLLSIAGLADLMIH